MRVILAPVDVAPCAACSGVLVAAGDDWRHREGTGCTELASPVICQHPDCGLPAAVGSEACAGCAGAFSSSPDAGSQYQTATA